MKFIVLAIALSISSAYAGIKELPPYVKMQEALAADNFTAAVNAHKEVCEGAKKFVPEYKGCDVEHKGIEELRASFKNLSKLYIAKVNKKDLDGLTKAYCPHAKAEWIQKDSALRNPYYGKSMLECGEKI